MLEKRAVEKSFGATEVARRLRLKGSPRKTGTIQKEGRKMTARVGKQAPDFTTKAYHEGMAKEIKLSDYQGKWVMLCFYPADFTCV